MLLLSILTHPSSSYNTSPITTNTPGIGIIARVETEDGAAALSKALTILETQPDILINNAGMVITQETLIPRGGVERTSSEWLNALNNNLTTAFYATRIVMPFMRSAQWVRIINVTSVTGAVMAARKDIGYAAAKAGMVGLTRALAICW